MGVCVSVGAGEGPAVVVACGIALNVAVGRGEIVKAADGAWAIKIVQPVNRAAITKAHAALPPLL